LQTYGAEGLVTHQDLALAQYHPERRYIKLKEQGIEVRFKLERKTFATA
jgi:hypothetical protein